VQRALTEAYERNDLRGKALLQARRLIDKRRSEGKTVRRGIDTRGRGRRRIQSDKLLKTYREETARQKLVIQKAKACETRILFVVSAMRRLFRDEDFVNLLRAETLDDLPQPLAERLKRKDG